MVGARAAQRSFDEAWWFAALLFLNLADGVFTTVSKVSEVYGSLTTAIVVLFSLEIGATLLLLGAQVISEYERLGRAATARAPEPMRTG